MKKFLPCTAFLSILGLASLAPQTALADDNWQAPTVDAGKSVWIEWPSNYEVGLATNATATITIAADTYTLTADDYTLMAMWNDLLVAYPADIAEYEEGTTVTFVMAAAAYELYCDGNPVETQDLNLEWSYVPSASEGGDDTGGDDSDLRPVEYTFTYADRVVTFASLDFGMFKESYTYATLTKGEEEVATIEASNIKEGYIEDPETNLLIVTIPEDVTLDEGDYTLTVPKDAYLAYDYYYWADAQPTDLVATFTITATGINTIAAEKAATNDVYTTTGICILRNASANQINQLPKGIYIIGGKKIRK